MSYRLIDPGSEWRLHRQWFENSAIADLLDEDYCLAAKDTLYRCLDRPLKHWDALFIHLQQRWKEEFQTSFDVLLYDLTSTYFESDPPFAEGDTCQWADPGKLWEPYLLLTEIEAAFKSLRVDLGIRSVYHQQDREGACIYTCALHGLLSPGEAQGQAQVGGWKIDTRVVLENLPLLR